MMKIEIYTKFINVYFFGKMGFPNFQEGGI